MRKFLAILLLLLTPLSLPAQTLEQNVYNAGAVVFGKEPASGQIRPWCSASAIAELAESEYIFLTAGHCVAGVNDRSETTLSGYVLFISPNISTKALSKALVIAVGRMEKGEDWALLKAKSEFKFNILHIQQTPRATFEDILSVGTPLGVAKILLRGYVSEDNITTSLWPRVFLLQLNDVAPGSSGSPVVCKSTGEICGILVGLGPANIVIAIPVGGIPYDFK